MAATPGLVHAASKVDTRSVEQPDSFSKPSEPSALLPQITERGTQKDSVFKASPLGPLHDSTTKSKQDLYNATGLKLGFALTHVFEAITDSVSDEDEAGTATTTDLVASWEVKDRGKPTAGKLVAHVQGRWDYGTTGPENLGFVSLGSALGTADTFSEYVPTFILRNVYWRHGSSDAG